MKLSDFIFRFPSRGLIITESICRVRIFVSTELVTYAVLTDLGDKNPGPSVTNSVEHIREKLLEDGLITNKTHIIEHYEKSPLGNNSFDFVYFDNNNNPSWKSTSFDKISALISCNSDEFSIESLETPTIYNKIEVIRHTIDPHIGEPLHESSEVINRRADIAQNRLPHGVLTAAIENGASESKLQALIKSDLSIIGDFYSQPSEEYICFSEFPLSDGFVDFVVFSGRSRMDVTLIEIKGADYNLINGNSYEDFSAKTNQAAQQIRKRLGYIHRNYEKFREFVHNVRHTVEQGRIKYNSLIGPRGKLGVDPKKDINLHTIVIGGRSKDDIHESRLRHEYERGTSPSTRIESWDSWIKKSKRK